MNFTATNRKETSLDKRRILIVDPNEDMRRLAITTLRDTIYNGKRHDVVVASDSIEGLMMFRDGYNSQSPFDAVILDSKLAETSPHFLNDLNKIHPYFKLLVSGIEMQSSLMKHPQEHGFSDSVIKPYCAIEVHDTIEKALNNQKN